MRALIVVAALLCLPLPAAAQPSGTVTFVAPSTGGVPSSFRLFRDTTDLGAVVVGTNTVANMFPASTGTWTFAIESRNAACGASPLPTCARVTQSYTLGPPPLQPPGPVINVTISAPCATASPPTCTVTVTAP